MDFDLTRLKERCWAEIEDFSGEGSVFQTPDGIYIHKDNGSKVLAVAHLDTVNKVKHFKIREKHHKVYCAQLDDRAGAHVILDILKDRGIFPDILLTEGEETNHSTAKHFKTDKKYNWIFSFDRRSDGVVGYSYTDATWDALVKTAGFRREQGSYSDIASLTGLGVKGFNFGVGYHNEHSVGAHLDLKQLEGQVKRFEAFYEEYKETLMPHTIKTWEKPAGYWDGNSWQGGHTNYYIKAEVVFDYDPEVLIVIKGYKDVVVPLSELLEMVSLYELKNIVKKGGDEVRIDRKYLEPHLELVSEAN